MGRVIISCALLLALSGCQQAAWDDPDRCIEWNDSRGWLLMAPPPQHAELMVQLAESVPMNPDAPANDELRKELWFSLPSGETRLCRVGFDARRWPVSVWWDFSAGEKPTVLDGSYMWKPEFVFAG